MLTPELILIIGFCLIGSSYTSWKIGEQKGIEAALDYLHSIGVIELEDD
jgi:flavin-binding protein dodecin